ncbi:TonB-dependent receptor [Hyphococcus luteus]|uniref:TonB-dependent receptor n=1 Tax=Hyphococcus luteus TaxID=2058213 RepID=A0A2S7JYN6_9PROT|nr:TonB-dependent receptor [Marinicaulis flavus]PQA85364.1 TonB-dependent receptor [Marinicaulis flavus]
MTTRKTISRNIARMGVSMAALAGGVGLADAALAQTDEIVVTAQFREQNVQDTPLAVTAVSGDMLNRRSQTEISEIARQAPNVTLAGQNQEYGSAMIAYIRGIGQNDPNFAVEPGVGIYIDDVYLPTLTGSLLDLMDVDRVEVLRGPQGTLAGRNSIGGAIKMYSVKPRGDNSGSLQVTYGSYDRLDIRGIYDVPLTEDLAMRVSAVSKNEDGYIKRLDYNLTHPGTNVPTQAAGNDPVLGTLGGHAIAAGKIAFRWTPNDRLDVNLSGDYTRERNEAGVATLQLANAEGYMNANPARPWLTGTDGAAIPYNCMFVPHGVNSCDTQTQFDGRYITYATFNDLYPGDSQQPYKPFALDPHRDMDNYGTALTINYDLSDTLSVYSITSYRKYETDWSYDVDGSPLAPNILNQKQTNEQVSQEIRLNGTLADNFIDFTLGGFYFDTDGFYTARVDLPYAGIDFIHGPDPTPSNNKAIFGNVTFNFSDAFHLTGGVRQSWDKKEYQYFRHNPDYTDIEGPCNFFLGAMVAGPVGLGNQPNCLLFGINGTEATFKNDRLDWRVAADYRFNDALMVYGQIATGYRAGGFNARPFFPSQATPHVPETIRSYEIGFKSDLFDDTLRLNVAGFYFPYDNIVLLSTYCADLADMDQATPCLRPDNVGSAKVKGFEAEAFFYPTSNFSIDASLSYLDFQYKEIDELAGTGVALGDVTPYTPEWQYSFGVQYDVNNVFGGDLSFRVDGSYQSEIFTEAGNVRERLIPSDVVAESEGFEDIGLNGGGGPIDTLVADNLIDGYFLGNARVMWNSGDGDWGIAFEVKNMFDKYYFTTKVNDIAAVGHVYGSPGKPRTWAVTVKRNF